MTIVKINNVRYTLPLTPQEISYKLGSEIDDIIGEFYTHDEISELDSLGLECCKHILSCLLQTDYDIIDQVQDDQIIKLVNTHPHIKSLLSSDLKLYFSNYLCLRGVIYKYNSLNIDKFLSVQDYSDMDFSLSEEKYDELIMNLYKRVNISQAPIKWLYSKLFIRSYKSIYDLPYSLVWGIIYQFIQYKSELLDYYALIEKDNIPDDQKDQTETEQVNNNTDYSTASWGVFHLIQTFTDGNIIQFNEWLKQDIRLLFKYISYYNLKAKEENIRNNYNHK